MISERISLYLKQAKSDKVYNASLEEVEGNHFLVNFAYGRRGATLRTGTKTKKPVKYASARKIYDKLVLSKTSKGYKPTAEGSQYTHTYAEARQTGVQCQLLNPLKESDVTELINNDDWWAQEKHDGKRMLIRKTDAVTAINRRGLSVGAPDIILNDAKQVSQTYLVDGEAVGEKLLAFDLLSVGNTDLKPSPYSERLVQLESLGLKGSIIVVKTAKSSAEKQELYERLQMEGAEGIVFKQHSAPYIAGRPNSGGTQRKSKFYATVSVIVTKINQKRSVAVAVMDDGEEIEVGNVTIPPNKEIPAEGSVIEVRYLYAYRGGSLYQPTYLGLRDEISQEECDIDQLKYKRKTG